jgi:uncharacterized membrane protein YphA (DoxX/SURF4 family)
VQRLFSSFATGWPGAGLLLLRTVSASVAMGQGVVCLANLSDLTLGGLVAGPLAIVSATALLIGLVTPAAGMTLAVAMVLFWFPRPVDGLFLDAVASILVAANALAVAFLGPGAFSIDARLFGRREIFVPRDTKASG